MGEQDLANLYGYKSKNHYRKSEGALGGISIFTGKIVDFMGVDARLATCSCPTEINRAHKLQLYCSTVVFLIVSLLD